MLGIFFFFLSAVAPAVAAAAPDAHGDVTRVFSEVERLERAQYNQTADVVRSLDKRAQVLAPSVLRWGHEAVAPLLAIARDAARPPKTRLLAVSVMGLTRDPGAFTALEGLLLDDTVPDALRSEAAVGLGGVGVSKAARRAAFCEALADAALPPQTLRESLLAVSELGCDDVALLERRARASGLRPAGADAQRTALALKALGRSPSPEAARALWRLFELFPVGSPERASTLLALLSDEARLATIRDENELRAPRALSQEASTPANAALAARLAARVGTPACAKALRRALRNSDPEVLAEAGEGLARLKVVAALKDLEKILANAHADARFAPKPGRPDPAAQLSRLQAATASLR